MKLIKILVAYHKPAKLFKDDVFEPIHVGRACSTLSDEEKQWMLDNMIGDDTGDNISVLNPHFAEMTAIYWAWKNYDKLGNPDYIGFCHYRRLFSQEDIDSFADYDITAPFETNGGAKTSQKIWQENHRTSDLLDAVALLCQKNKKYDGLVEPYLAQTQGYYYNMFIMKKELFLEYCEIIFDILFKIHKRQDYQKVSYYNCRMPGFVAERLTGLFIAEKEAGCLVKKCQHWHVEESAKIDLLPKFGKEGVSICLSADDNYAPYLGVMISSIKAHRQPKDKYEIYVLDGDISLSNKKRVLSLEEDGFFVKFIDIKSYLTDIDTSIFALNAYFTIATYYRFFIPEIFMNFSKILYLDCDLAAHEDVAVLYRMNMRKYALAAVPDIGMHCALMAEKLHKGNIFDYLTQKLAMKHPESYFQAGVLLLDIKKLQQMNFTNACLKKLTEIQNPMYVDQCVLNAVFDSNYLPLEMKWNVLWHHPYYVKHLEQLLSYEKYTEYFSARKNPYIVHYAGKIKPWNNPEVDLAEIWWKYAKFSPFYEEVIYKKINSIINVDVLRDRLNLSWNMLKYIKYNLYSVITFGRKRKKYKQKKKDMKNRLKQINKFFKENT